METKVTARSYSQSHARVLLIILFVTVLGACGGGGGSGGGMTVTAPHTWVAANGMLTPRSGHTATLLQNGKVLVVGGTDTNASVVASAELYDPSTGTWTYTGAMNTPRFQHTATLLPNGTVLIAGGNDNRGYCCQGLASAEIYDPSSGAWTDTGSMHDARGSHVAVLLPNGKVLVAGNYLYDGTAELYDPSTGTWTYTGSEGSNTTSGTSQGSNLAALLPDGRVLALVVPPEIYDPAANVWTATVAIPGTDSNFGPFFVNLTSLKNGTALTAGGFYWEGGPNGAFPPIAAAFLYQPSMGAWIATGNMTEARDSPTATVLQDGTVLVFGGGSSNTDTSAELYDPSTGIWSATGSMITPRYLNNYSTATLLQDGKVLVAGGVTGSTSIPTANAEIYFP